MSDPSDLCTNVDTLLSLYETLTNQIKNTNIRSPTETAAIQRLKDYGIPLAPKKRRSEGETEPKKRSKTDTGNNTARKKTNAQLDDIADERIKALLPDTLPPALTPDEFVELLLNPTDLATPEDENDILLDMMRGFAAPETGWGPILTAAGVHPDQKVTIQTAIAAAAAKVPGEAVALVTAESNLLSLIKTNCVDNYAAGRILLCETMFTQQAWNKLSNTQRGAHNRDLYIAQNPTLFDPGEADEEKHKALSQDGKHWEIMNKFLRNDRERLTTARNQISNLGQVFGLAAVIHPAASVDSFGRRAVNISRVCKRLHLALEKRPELRREIEARADGNLNVIREVVSGMVVAENKDAVRKYFTDFLSRVPPYKY
ncbi:hypothetical protein B0H11DRAFT_2099199 [Mycena galericulata]|nr:hypothetical protein B0H11DRAFT_2099199 [Mycena galericulata]